VIGAGNIFAFAWRFLRWPVALALLIAWATTLYHVAPNRARTLWREDVPGAALTAVLWLASSLGLHLYLQVAADGNPVFGILGGGLILLIWLYLLSLSLLVGGEFNTVLREPARPASSEDDLAAVDADTDATDSRLAG
jgi:membrane protein